MTDFEVQYSTVDRLVHHLAMGQLETQKLLSRLEDRSFDQSHPDISASDPIFITSLPRAGTTLLLEVFARAPEFASHTYRDMPFLLCPLLWDWLSGQFRKRAESHERAHGDGMMIGYESVEALEEVLWLAHWPAHFAPRVVCPWAQIDEDQSEEFTCFLRQHMRKIIALRRRRTGTAAPRRYVSKNNANIARLAWLEEHFPDAIILIPYRNPLSQISSLMGQHRRFLEVQDQDPFVLRYMNSVGHFEFGKGFRPINFDGWLSSASDLDLNSPDFWAEYWIAAFNAVLRTAGPRAVIFSYDRLCEAPKESLETLEARLGVDAGGLTPSASRFRLPTQRKPTVDIAPDRLRRLDETLARLDERAIF